MAMYEYGIAVAFMCELAWAITGASLSFLSGWRRSNFLGLGMRISWLTGEPKPTTVFYEANKLWLRPLKVLLALAWIGAASILSWFMVIMFLVRIFRWHANLTLTPESKKAFLSEVCSRPMAPRELFDRLVLEAKIEDRVARQWRNETNDRLQVLGFPPLDSAEKSTAA